MNKKGHQILTYMLKPMSWLYGLVTDARNWLFDHKVIHQTEFDIPVVTVGNITVGGTGKTPHVEYLVGMLGTSYNTAVLSRGYKRKTKGFIVANSNSTPESVGDEPLQIYQKFGSRVKVAVCEDRSKGICELQRLYPDLQLIILDDGYQHRYVKPAVSVLLMDYNRPIYEDNLLPLGRLRESAHQISRADMVIVTKCPSDLTPLSYRLVSKKLDLMPYQKLYFSNYNYGGLLPVFPDDDPYRVSLEQLTSRDTVMLVSGVANPRGFVKHFKNYPFKVRVNHFSDHHDFSREELEKLEEKFRALPGERKVIVTTEKDAMRLAYNPYFPTYLKPFTFYIPIRVKMLAGLEEGDMIEDLRKMIDNHSRSRQED